MSAANNSAAKPGECAQPSSTSATASIAAKFEAAGIEYSAKYLGSCQMADGQSQLLCQEAMQRLLQGLKGRKEPKERLKIALSLDGIRLLEVGDGEGKLDLRLRHCEVSYVYKEPRDSRSCGLVRTEPDPEGGEKKNNRLYAIRTLKSATPMLQDMRELFQLVKERQQQQQQMSDEAARAAPETNGAAEEAPASESQQLPVPRHHQAAAPQASAPESTAPEVTAPEAAAPESAAPPQSAPVVSQAAAASGAGPDLLDMSQPELPVRQSMASSSVGSLDELNELFSSQASLASSSGGGQTAVSFNPWAIQPQQQPQLHQPQQPQLHQQQQQQRLPMMMLNRQFSQPHPVPAGYGYANRDPTRKASHPNLLEPSHVTPGPVYHDNKRPSDPGILQAFAPPEFQQFQQQHQQQQQQAAFYGQYQPEYQYQPQHQYQQMYGPGPYGPMYTSGQTAPYAVYAGPTPPVFHFQASPPSPPQPALPPTSATQLLDGDFVSVFDQPEQQ